MKEQVGWRAFVKSLRAEAPNYAILLPQLPRLLHRYLTDGNLDRNDELLNRLLEQHRRYNTLLTVISLTLLALVAFEFFIFSTR